MIWTIDIKTIEKYESELRHWLKNSYISDDNTLSKLSKTKEEEDDLEAFASCARQYWYPKNPAVVVALDSLERRVEALEDKIMELL